MSFGGRSLEIMICLPAVCRWLKVWKNSSWVLSFPIRNWISSIRSTSVLRYFSRKSDIEDSRPFFNAWISSFVNVSLVTYTTFFLGLKSRIKCAIECIRCVLPSPTPPYKKRGLYTSPGDSATARDAACAKLLLLPTINVSNVYLGLRPAFSAAVFVFLLSVLAEDIFLSSSIRSSSSERKTTSYSIPVISAIQTFSGREYFFSM